MSDITTMKDDVKINVIIPISYAFSSMYWQRGRPVRTWIPMGTAFALVAPAAVLGVYKTHAKDRRGKCPSPGIHVLTGLPD